MAVPVPSPRAIRVLAFLAGAALVTYLITATAGVVVPALRELLSILAPLLVAFAIAYLVAPAVDWLEDHRVPRGLGVALLGLALVATAALALVLVVPALVEQVQVLGPKLAHYVDLGTVAVRGWLGERHPQGLEKLRAWIQGAILDVDWSRLVERVLAWAKGMAAGGYGVLLLLFNVILVPVLAAYLLKDMKVIREALAGLVPPGRREALLEPLREVNAALAGFVRGQLMVAMILAGLYSVGLIASGTPLGLTLGLFAGAVSFIPYLGLVLGLLPALALNALEHGSPWHLAGVVATFAIAQVLESLVITPRVVGEKAGLHPVVVIVGVVAGGALFGLAGMLLALPAAAAAMVFLRRGVRRYRTSRFYLGKAAAGKAAAGEATPDEAAAGRATAGRAMTDEAAAGEVTGGKAAAGEN